MIVAQQYYLYRFIRAVDTGTSLYQLEYQRGFNNRAEAHDHARADQGESYDQGKCIVLNQPTPAPEFVEVSY